MNREPCEQCGQVHERCARHNRSGQPCRAWPKRGTTVCTAPTHGGRLPRVKAAAERNVAEAEIAEAAGKLGAADPVTDPLSELAQFAGDMKRWKDLAARRVERLNEQIRYTAEGQGTEQLRAEVSVLERAMAEFRRTLVDIARLNIDERLAKIQQQQADAFLDAFTVGLAAAGVTGTRAEEARAASAQRLRHLRLVQAS